SRAVTSEEPLERLDLTRRCAREAERSASNRRRSVAAVAPACKEPFSTPDALLEGANPTFERRLAGNRPWGNRDGDAGRGQVRRGRRGGPCGVGGPVVPSARLGVRLQQCHHTAFRRRQWPVLWKARRPFARLLAIVVTGGAGDRIPRVGRAR